MSRLVAVLFLLAAFIGYMPGAACATIESSVVETLKLPGEIVDSTNSGDGQMLFVLTGQGKVYVYSNSGKLLGDLDVEGRPDLINASTEGNVLYLTDRDGGSVQIVSVDFLQNIETTGSPFKGPENAPVVVAVFSDFQ